MILTEVDRALLRNMLQLKLSRLLYYDDDSRKRFTVVIISKL